MYEFTNFIIIILSITATYLISKILYLARWIVFLQIFLSYRPIKMLGSSVCIIKSLTKSAKVKHSHKSFFQFCRFFGQEPPMMKVFLKELGYEVREIYWQTTDLRPGWLWNVWLLWTHVLCYQGMFLRKKEHNLVVWDTLRCWFLFSKRSIPS